MSAMKSPDAIFNALSMSVSHLAGFEDLFKLRRHVADVVDHDIGLDLFGRSLRELLEILNSSTRLSMSVSVLFLILSSSLLGCAGVCGVRAAKEPRDSNVRLTLMAQP